MSVRSIIDLSTMVVRHTSLVFKCSECNNTNKDIDYHTFVFMSNNRNIQFTTSYNVQLVLNIRVTVEFYPYMHLVRLLMFVMFTIINSFISFRVFDRSGGYAC